MQCLLWNWKENSIQGHDVQCSRSIADLGNRNTPFLCANARTGCTNFVGLLYGSKACISLDALRKDKVLSNKHVRPRMLPPTDDSFVLHLMRCLYQLLVWKVIRNTNCKICTHKASTFIPLLT